MKKDSQNQINRARKQLSAKEYAYCESLGFGPGKFAQILKLKSVEDRKKVYLRLKREPKLTVSIIREYVDSLLYGDADRDIERAIDWLSLKLNADVRLDRRGSKKMIVIDAGSDPECLVGIFDELGYQEED